MLFSLFFLFLQIQNTYKFKREVSIRCPKIQYLSHLPKHFALLSVCLVLCFPQPMLYLTSSGSTRRNLFTLSVKKPKLFDLPGIIKPPQFLEKMWLYIPTLKIVFYFLIQSQNLVQSFLIIFWLINLALGIEITSLKKKNY